MSNIKRTFPSTHEATSLALDLLLEFADENRVPEEVVERMILVVGEAVSNSVEHGNAAGTSATLELTLAVDSEAVTMCVLDEGLGITQDNLDKARLPDDPFDMDGRGLYIIKETSDRVWLEEEGRRLCVSWQLPTAAA